MPRRTRALQTTTIIERVLDPPQETVLDVIDHLLNKGVIANGEVTLGVAGVDLIYLRLSALLCAADRLLPQNRRRVARRRSTPRPRRLKKP